MWREVGVKICVKIGPETCVYGVKFRVRFTMANSEWLLILNVLTILKIAAILKTHRPGLLNTLSNNKILTLFQLAELHFH